MSQGCGSEATVTAGFILDRLEGLCKVISPEVIEQALADSGVKQQ
jgi:hypothetical protein